MLNVNSPTVQAMLNNTPQGTGNMPVYFGNQPQLSTEVQQQPVQPSTGCSTPYPSPKDMVMAAGVQQQQVAGAYYPTGFGSQPQRFIGGYTPPTAPMPYGTGFQQTFQGYSNPYMGYGSYMGYQNQEYMPPFQYMDERTREIYNMSIYNGMTYFEQLQNDTSVSKAMSRAVSKALGRSEEETQELENSYDIQYVTPPHMTLYEESEKSFTIKPMVVRGEDVIFSPEPKSLSPAENDRNISFVDRLTKMKMQEDINKCRVYDLIHMNAPERQFDDKDFMYFMNYAAGPIYNDMVYRQMRQQRFQNAASLYDHAAFRKRLLENNGIQTREQAKAVDRFVGRYGMLPNGMPVSPQHDPSIASSFSYNPATGSYEIQAPNFIRDRLDAARQRFINSISDNANE